jgi:HEAT repeat protein
MNQVLPQLRRARALWLLLALLPAACGTKPPYEGKSVVQLEAMLRSADATTQVQGAYGLSLLGAEARAAVPALIDVLQGGGSLARQNAALALGKIGPDARAAVPALARMLRDPDWLLRRQAAIALGEIGPDAGPAGAELKRLKRDLPAVRQAAADALAKIAPSPPKD